MDNEFKYEITEKIAILSENTTGNYTMELNRISYNGSTPKIDVRKWNKKSNKMLKGITLTDDEAKALKEALNRII